MGGFNVRDMLAAEQAKFQGEITEDKFKYKNMNWICRYQSMS